jgi:8-oxo-dGTP pyrophosphatase MutT (NUDIX family)
MDESALSLLDELRLLAQNGLEYAEDPYDRERYERILELVAGEYADAADLPPGEVHERFAERVGHVTPNVGGRAGVVDDDGRLLVMERADDGQWGLPGGYSDPGETPAATAVREAREETGLEVAPAELVTFTYREADAANPHGFVGGVYRCTVEDGRLSGSHESEAVAYRHPEDVPAWHKDHGEVAEQVLASWRDR